jgi:hypothetical protein
MKLLTMILPTLVLNTLRLVCCSTIEAVHQQILADVSDAHIAALPLYAQEGDVRFSQLTYKPNGFIRMDKKGNYGYLLRCKNRDHAL